MEPGKLARCGHIGPAGPRGEGHRSAHEPHHEAFKEQFGCIHNLWLPGPTHSSRQSQTQILHASQFLQPGSRGALQLLNWSLLLPKNHHVKCSTKYFLASPYHCSTQPDKGTHPSSPSFGVDVCQPSPFIERN